MKTINTPVKGFKDFTGLEALKREEIKKILTENFKLYGFEPAEAPIIENESFVKGDNTSDEAVSDIYKLKDKGNRKLALRYELTFQLKRLAKAKKLPYKRLQIGPVFRDEPSKSNRFRQFIQCDVDVVGSSIKDEAEILAITYNMLKQLGIDAEIFFNNRKLLNEILDEASVEEKDKEQVIREIDKLDKLPEKEVKQNLKKFKAESVIDKLKKPEKSFEKYKSYSEIKKLKDYCKLFSIKAIFRPYLARGLSYYNGSVFEVKTKKVRETITAGGSYLVNGIQSTGISFGLERLSALSKVQGENIEFLIISLNQDKEAIKLAQKLRGRGKTCSIYYGKPSKALAYANAYKIKKAIFVGEKEVKSKKFKVKDLDSGKESLLKI